MPNSNIARIIGGPALVRYRGAAFYTKDDVTIEEEVTPFDIPTSRFGPETDKRLDQRSVRIRFTPAGLLEAFAQLYPYRTAVLGSLITPQRIEVESIETTTDVITATAHGLADGDLVLVEMAIGGTFPTLGAGALSDTTKYYVHAPTADTLTLHTSEADGLSGDNPMNFTSAPTGTMFIDRDHPLVVHGFDGEKNIFHNAAVTGQPDIDLSSVKTFFGQVEFGAFVRNGFSPEDANSIETVSYEELSAPEFNPADIVTGPATAAWGSAAPWDSFESKEGWKFRFPVTLEPRGNDRIGNRTMRLVAASALALAIPDGIDGAQLSAKLRIQGAGATRGARLAGGDNLNVYGASNNPYVRIYGARLRTGPRQFGARLDRIGECEWFAARTFTGGAPDPLFFVGTAAPA